MCKKAMGKRIRKTRETKGYSRDEIAERAEISVKFLYEIETGRKNFSVLILARLASALSVDCEYIVFGDGRKQISNRYY